MWLKLAPINLSYVRVLAILHGLTLIDNLHIYRTYVGGNKESIYLFIQYEVLNSLLR